MPHHFKCQSSEFKQWGYGVDVKKTPRTQVGMCTSAEVEGEEKGIYDSLKQRSSRCQSTSYKTGRSAAFDILHPSFKSVIQRADEYLPADECLKTRRWQREDGKPAH